MRPIIKVIIPAYNEEASISLVVQDIPRKWVNEVIVIDNASNDQTAERAKTAGATVLTENKPGYGRACLKGMDYLASLPELPDIVVFLDGDYSDYPEQLPEVVAPIVNDEFDMVIGSRAKGEREKGSMTFPQVFGNALATRMMRAFYGVRYSDLGPFRAIRYEALMQLGMEDKTYGWTVEMQLKATKKQLKITEVPVNYKNELVLAKYRAP